MVTNMQAFLRSLHEPCRRLLTVAPVVARARNRAVNLTGPRIGFLAAITIASVLSLPTATIAAEAQANRMTVEYVPPTNPGHQTLYKKFMERRVLEKLQEVFSPFRLTV